jgi:hypothetical protein
MPDTPDPALVQSVANDNTKTVAGQPALLANLSLQNLVAHQQRLQLIAEAATGNVVKNLSELDPAQAAAVLKTTQGDMGAQLQALLTALASGQQSAKVAQTTPPPTA